jgi:hypothetical protein
MTEHFQVADDLKYFDEIDDRGSARQFIRQLILPDAPAKEPTPEQRYLRDLLEVPGPAMQACRAANRLMGAKARPSARDTSTTFVSAARDLSFEAYHFHERLKEHLRSSLSIHIVRQDAAVFQKRMVRIAASYKKANDRLLRYRNFVVHGPKNRVDEFSDLRLAELCATTMHDDLWFEYRNVLEECKQEWTAIAKQLVRSMEASLAMVQNENENAIDEGRLTFSRKAGFRSNSQL